METLGRGAGLALVVAAPRVAEIAAFCLPPCLRRRMNVAAKILAIPVFEEKGREDHNRDRVEFVALATLDRMRVACRLLLLPLEMRIAALRNVVSNRRTPSTWGGAKVQSSREASWSGFWVVLEERRHERDSLSCRCCGDDVG